jgi:trk system potassium uptake protein TrkA
VYILIAGAGGIGLELAERLIKKGNKVVIIEKDTELCKKIAGSLDALVIQGSITDLDVLKELEMDKIDMFAATTGDDSTNMLACFLAKRRGIKKIAAIINDSRNYPIFSEIGAETLVSPDSTIAKDLMRSMFDISESKLHSIPGTEIIDIPVTPVTKLIGKKIKELDLSSQDKCSILGVYRGEELHFSRPDFELKGEDMLIVITKPEFLNNIVKKYKVEDIA